MNEATDPTPDSITSSPNTSRAFNMRVLNDEDTDHHLLIAETGSTKGNNSLLMTSDIPRHSPDKVKTICSQVPHSHLTPPAQPKAHDSESDDENHVRHRVDHSTPLRHNSVQLTSKLMTSGSRNKRKNFQPRSIFMVDDNDEENHFESNSNEETNGEQSDESDGLMNGKSGSESISSVCDSSEVQPQESSHRQSIVTSLTSITSIRRCASLQRNHSNHSALQPSQASQQSHSQSQPLDLSNQENDTKTNGQVVKNDTKTYFNDIKVNDNKLIADQSSATIMPTCASNAMDLSRKRSASEEDNDMEEESLDEEDVVDLRLNQILGLYGMKGKRSLVGAGNETVQPSTVSTVSTTAGELNLVKSKLLRAFARSLPFCL